MRIPSRQMLILRSVVTLQLSAVIGQAGWAAAALGRGDGRGRGLEPGYLHLHSVVAGVTLALCGIRAVLYVVFRRHSGPVNLWLALATLVAVIAQSALGEARLADVHVFLGVLIAMIVTALTSWTYRHDDGAPPAFGPEASRADGPHTTREGGARVA